MGNCCLKDQIAQLGQFSQKEFQRSISGEYKKLPPSQVLVASIIDINQSFDEESGQNFNEKESHKETFHTNDQSINLDVCRNPSDEREYEANDIQYFRPTSPPQSLSKISENNMNRRNSEKYIPHRFSSVNEEDLRGTMINYQVGNRFQGGLSVITEVSPIWQSSHMKSELGSSSSVPLRLTDKRSSLIRKGSNGSQLSNGSIIRISKESQNFQVRQKE